MFCKTPTYFEKKTLSTDEKMINFKKNDKVDFVGKPKFNKFEYRFFSYIENQWDKLSVMKPSVEHSHSIATTMMHGVDK